VTLRQQPDQEGVRLQGVAHGSPITEGLLGSGDEVERFLSREPAGGVVVRLMTRLLKVDEDRSNRSQRWLQSLTLERRAELRRDPVRCKSLGNRFHVRVRKRAAEALAQPHTIRTADKPTGRLMDEEVEERVVRSGDGTPEARLARTPGLASGQVLCLPKKVGVKAHTPCASEAPRNRT